jgi:hypothetical protein
MINLTEKQQNEALKLVGVLASKPCCGADEDQSCDEKKLPRESLCGPCHAFRFLRALPKGLR